MQACRALDHHPAMVIVTSDLLALASARDHGGAGLRRVVEALEAFFLRRVVLRRPGPDKPAALLPEAVDPFLFDQPLDQRERVRGVGQQPVGPLRIDLGGASGKALANIDAAANRAAVARAG